MEIPFSRAQLAKREADGGANKIEECYIRPIVSGLWRKGPQIPQLPGNTPLPLAVGAYLGDEDRERLRVQGQVLGVATTQMPWPRRPRAPVSTSTLAVQSRGLKTPLRRSVLLTQQGSVSRVHREKIFVNPQRPM